MDLNELIQPEKPDMRPVLTRRAILWGKDDLLSRSVSLFLEKSTTWNVIMMPNTGNVERLIKKIAVIKPDAVILCQDRSNGDAALPLRLINERFCPKVLIVNLENNLMQVYSKQDVIIQGVPDLMSAIEAGVIFDCSPIKEVPSLD